MLFSRQHCWGVSGLQWASATSVLGCAWLWWGGRLTPPPRVGARLVAASGLKRPCEELPLEEYGVGMLVLVMCVIRWALMLGAFNHTLLDLGLDFTIA